MSRLGTCSGPTVVNILIVTNDCSNYHATIKVSLDNNLLNGDAESNGVFEAIFQAIDNAVGVQGHRTGLRINAFIDYAPKLKLTLG